MRVFHQLVKVIAVALFVVGCGGDNRLEVGLTGTDTTAGSEILPGFESGPGFESALVQLPMEERRIAIVHSQTSKAAFYDAFAYNQLFASMQHQSMMAGVPFDLLDEAALASTADLLSYDAIVIPSFSYVQSSERDAIVNRLKEAQTNGIGIIAAGEFLSQDATGTAFTDYSGAMAEVLGVQPSVFLSEVSAVVRIADNTHPISQTYQANEEIMTFEQAWFPHFVPVEGAQATQLTIAKSNGVDYNAAQIIERESRVVHFANEQFLANNNQLWRVIQWMVYGDVAPVALQVSRSDHVFLPRNDMDQAMIAAELSQTEIPLLEILKEWKRDFNFVGSYYIDIGNNPANGEYTDWSVSGPLYREYIALGNEMGTHSWTHPHHTSQLTAAELEFEFKDSAAEIGNRLGVPVVGAAVPGMGESLRVVETLNPWLDYLSGRTGKAGIAFPGAFGFLEPQHSMMYFSLNMIPDFEAIDYLNNTPDQTKALWKNDIDVALKHAQTPLVHWLWHDYGPTTQTARGLYSRDMFDDTVAYAHGLGAEFVTTNDMHQRIRAFAGANFSVGSTGVITASVEASGVGQFALKVSEEAQKIKSVQNWYAYDDDQVFLPENGGQFVISVGSVADDVTRITALPMRAKLLNLTGDGDSLTFSIEGEGEVTIQLSDGLIGNASVTGADSFVENNGVITLRLDSLATRSIAINPVNPVNNAPVALGGSVTSESGIAASIALTGSDVDGDVLSYQVETQPINGTLSGTAPNLVYVSNAGFVGADSFSYSVNDGTLNSASVSYSVLVTAAMTQNSPPLANELVLESLKDQAMSFTLSGSDSENQGLSYSIVEQPGNGVISGYIPNLIYTPNAGFVGRDSITFVANDSITTSAPGKVIFNVEPQLGQAIGTISNPGSVLIDGNISEWANLRSFGVDPQDVSGLNNNIDWREAWMGHDASNLYIAYREHNASQLLWGNQVYLDTDSDTSTGFKGFSGQYTVGADFMIEGDALFRYNSALQDQWAWEYLGSVNSAIDGDTVELKVSRAQLGNPENLFLFFLGDSAASSGDAIDYYPDDVTDEGAVLRARRFSYSVNPNGNVENFAPVAFAQRIQISNNASYPLTLTGFDQDGDQLSYIIDRQPNAGTITGTAPNLTYTPNGTATQDLLVYKVSDGTAFSTTRSVQFFMVPPPAVNNRPSADNQSLTVVGPSSALPITLTASDVDNNALTYRVVNQPATGTLSGTAPNLVYTAGASIGTDSFTYVANDGVLDSAPATVSLSIEVQPPINRVPKANGLSLSTASNTAIAVTLDGTDADGDTLSYIVVTQPARGILSGTAPQLTYIPFASSVGADSFTFKVNDGADDSLVATVAINILPPVPVNRAPQANGQNLTTPFGSALNIVLSGRDLDQQALSFSVVSQPLSGTLAGSAPNLVYTPDSTFSGVDSFTFKVNDGELDSLTATINIDVGTPGSGVISNPVSGMTIDGALSDWNGLVSLGSDPADIGGIRTQNPLDWRQSWVAHSATDLFIAYRNHDAFSLSWGHGIYVDVDGDINTGFRGFYGEFPIGADYLIEVGDVQKYTGSGNNWGWLTVGEAEVATSGEIGELSIPFSVLSTQGTALSKLRFYFRANNAAFGGQAVDHFPDSAVDATAVSADRYLEYLVAP